MKFKNKFEKIALYMLIFCTLVFIGGCKKKEPAKDLLDIIKDRNKIIAGVKIDSKPFGFKDEKGNIQGFDIDLIREIAKRILGNPDAVEFKPITSSARLFAITSGDVDVVAATMTINEKRKRLVSFSSPYYIAGQGVVVHKDSNILNFKGLNKRKVIVIVGSTSEKNLRLLAPQATVKGFRTFTEAFEALKNLEADALTTDDTLIYGFLHDNPEFKILKARYTQEPYGIAFKKDISAKRLQQLINGTLEELKADGTLQRLKTKWTSDFLD